jgi:hypothetical protein
MYLDKGVTHHPDYSQCWICPGNGRFRKTSVASTWPILSQMMVVALIIYLIDRDLERSIYSQTAAIIDEAVASLITTRQPCDEGDNSDENADCRAEK